MRILKKISSLLLAIAMMLTMIPAAAFAAEEDVVYLSISFDSNYIDDKNGNPIAYVPVPMSAIEAIDLTEYGLDNMLYDVDEDGDYETTALQLLIYAHEELYGGNWGEVNFDALPGSSYFKGGIFGFTENLVYFHNGDFPVDESQQSDYMTVGATSDRIVLEAGDFLDVASFGCYAFLWDQQGGFHLFADENDNYTHDYTADAGEALSVKLKHSFCDLMYGVAWVKDAEDYEVYYGSVFGEAEGSVTTDGSGNAEITFPTAGTYYVWCEGGIGSEDGTHTSCEQCMETGVPCIVSSPAFAKVTVNGGESSEQPEQPEAPRQAQDVSAVLNATLAMQAETVTQPSFGTNYGEWTVFGLARGSYYAKDSQYFADYYDRIVEYVNTTAAAVDKSGALDSNKSTDNSRLIMALTAIGKNATSVGDWDLVEAYSANGINWIRKQGMNGTIWTLIALDCGGYETSDPTIRQQCVDAILNAQHDDGGWSLVTAKTQPSNVDITGMTLTALYPYRDQPAVAAACETAFNWLSESQLDNGGFPYGQGETSESCVWAIVACTTWGINPDTDPRFIKNGNSAIDNLLTYYLEDEAMFEHGRGAGANAMATDQATYGLVAYNRLVNGKSALYDYSDVIIDEPTPTKQDLSAALTITADKVKAGETFNGVLKVKNWDTESGYRAIDVVVSVPEGITVTDAIAGEYLEGGEIYSHLGDDGKLRVVYFDANQGDEVKLKDGKTAAELFTITFRVDETVASDSVLGIHLEVLSLKAVSASETEGGEAQEREVNLDFTETTVKPGGTVTVVPDSAVSKVQVLYTGDGVDLIPEGKKAVAVSFTDLAAAPKLVFCGAETEVEFYYSAEITAKMGATAYVALVDADIDNALFGELGNYEVDGEATAITFGDTNGDGTINAQDALNVVDTWLRKNEAPTDKDILVMNVNGDGRINTFDALGIVDAFVNNYEYRVVVKAAASEPNQ